MLVCVNQNIYKSKQQQKQNKTTTTNTKKQQDKHKKRRTSHQQAEPPTHTTALQPDNPLEPRNPNKHNTHNTNRQLTTGELAGTPKEDHRNGPPTQGNMSDSDHRRLLTSARAWEKYEDELAAAIAASTDPEPHSKRRKH